MVNALFRTGPAPIPAEASVDIRWTGTGQRAEVSNEPGGFRATYEAATATVGWSASSSTGYSFSTEGSTDSVVTHAFTAKIRNGVFAP